MRWSKGEVRDVDAYLRRAVANEANPKLRRRYLERAVAGRRSGDERGVRTIDDGAADRDQVWQAIRRLPDTQRKAVVLRYYETGQATLRTIGCDEGPGTGQSATDNAQFELEVYRAGPWCRWSGSRSRR